MSYAAVAKKDFQDGIRSKLLWALMALFLISVVGIAWLFTDSAGGTTAASDLDVALFFAISSLPAILFLVPLTGLIVSIKSIVRERELGSIKIILSLPHSRQEVLGGKMVGRSALLTIAILVGFIPGAAVLMAQFSAFPIFELAVLTLMTLLFGIAFVAIGLGVSALVSTETRATVVGVAAFFLFYSWSGIFNYLNGRLDLVTGDARHFILRFDLFTVFQDGLLALLSLVHSEIPNGSMVVFTGQVLNDPESVNAVSHPFYLQHWFSFAILAVWIAVPLAIGYWRFERADL